MRSAYLFPGDLMLAMPDMLDADRRDGFPFLVVAGYELCAAKRSDLQAIVEPRKLARCKTDLCRKVRMGCDAAGYSRLAVLKVAGDWSLCSSSVAVPRCNGLDVEDCLF